LLHEIKRNQETIRSRVAADSDPRAGVHHLVLASDAPVFNLGGDLALFSRLIRAGERGRLLDYARLCVEVAYNFSQLYGDRVHSVAVVQGDALGGGFEAACAATRSSPRKAPAWASRRCCSTCSPAWAPTPSSAAASPRARPSG
jgi:hypothetical protein